MKNLLKLLVLFFVFSVGFISCKNDACEPDPLEEMIIGSWKYSNGLPGSFEFRSDGTLIDQDGIIAEGEIPAPPLEAKTWSLDENGDLILRVTSIISGAFNETVLMVDDFVCDKIVLSLEGVPVQIERL